MKFSNLLTRTIVGVGVSVLVSCAQELKPAVNQNALSTPSKSIIVRVAGDAGARDFPKVALIASDVDLRGADIESVESAFESGSRLNVEDGGIPIDGTTSSSGHTIKLDTCRGAGAVTASLEKQLLSNAFAKIVKTESAKDDSKKAAEDSFQSFEQFFVNDFMPTEDRSNLESFVYGCKSDDVEDEPNSDDTLVRYPIVSQIQGDKITYYVYAAPQVEDPFDSSELDHAEGSEDPSISTDASGEDAVSSDDGSFSIPESISAARPSPHGEVIHSTKKGYTQIFYAPKPLATSSSAFTSKNNAHGG